MPSVRAVLTDHGCNQGDNEPGLSALTLVVEKVQ
jgi:hypothetical protein